eukprot:scaffold4912_cov284-Chaetoceros_neogracile.AAC.11
MRSNQKQNKRKEKNSWSEQEDALFGPSPANLSNLYYCEPCINTTTRHNDDASKEPRKASVAAARRPTSNIDDQKRKVTMPALAKTLVGNASSRVANVISMAKSEISKRPQYHGNQNSAAARARVGVRRGTALSESSSTVSSKIHVKNGGNSSRQSVPSFTTPALNNHSDIIRNVRNAALAQVPNLCSHCHAFPLRAVCHPFFGPSERICSSHPPQSIIRCISCFRFQPKYKPFQQLGTSAARICNACARTAVLDDNAARRLYENILSFMEGQGLDMFQGKMFNVPIQLVDEDTMNQHDSTIGCDANEKKGGLTIWSEVHAEIPILSGVARGIANATSAFRGAKRNESDRDTGGEVLRNIGAGIRHASVKRILILKGFPENLMASVLAHEATHAWLCYDPIRRYGVPGEPSSFGQVRRIDQTVEEGLCQLVSYLYLQHLTADDKKRGISDMVKSFTGGDPSDLTLNQYYKWAIENHSSPVYGGGFKKAAKAYSQTLENGGGLKELFQYVSMHRDFPP